MTYTKFLVVALPAVAIPALVILFLPDVASSTYISVLEPLALLIGAFLALYVSFLYRKALRTAFVFLGAYLFIYMLAIILLPLLRSAMGNHFGELVFAFQIINYSMLVLFCINILKVIDIRYLDRNGWILFSIVFATCTFIAVYPILPLTQDILALQLPAVSYALIRIADAGLIIVLTPVIWLYVQYLKSQQKQSLTFTVIIFGIVWSTISDYILELISQAAGTSFQARIPDMLFIFGYLIIAVGLYAHRKQDKWGYNVIDRTISRGLD